MPEADGATVKGVASGAMEKRTHQRTSSSHGFLHRMQIFRRMPSDSNVSRGHIPTSIRRSYRMEQLQIPHLGAFQIDSVPCHFDLKQMVHAHAVPCIFPIYPEGGFHDDGCLFHGRTTSRLTRFRRVRPLQGMVVVPGDDRAQPEDIRACVRHPGIRMLMVTHRSLQIENVK